MIIVVLFNPGHSVILRFGPLTGDRGDGEEERWKWLSPCRSYKFSMKYAMGVEDGSLPLPTRQQGEELASS